MYAGTNTTIAKLWEEYTRKKEEKLAKQKERKKEKQIKWMATNPEYFKEHSRKWREKNPSRHLENVKKWQAANPERVRENRRRFIAANPDRVLYYSRKANAKKYGLTVEKRDAMLVAQGGCACCGTKKPGSKKGWHIDHCHTTGKVRGMLCHNCNIALGHAKDNIETLKSMIAYLEKHAHDLN